MQPAYWRVSSQVRSQRPCGCVRACCVAISLHLRLNISVNLAQALRISKAPAEALWHECSLPSQCRHSGTACPGYYIFFVGLSQWSASSSSAIGVPGPSPSSPSDNDTTTAPNSVLVRLACFVWTQGCFAFYGGAFNLLDWRETLALWRALKFYGLWLTAVPILPALARLAMNRATLPSPRRRSTPSKAA